MALITFRTTVPAGRTDVALLHFFSPLRSGYISFIPQQPGLGTWVRSFLRDWYVVIRVCKWTVGL